MVKFVSFSTKMSKFFLPRKRKAGPVLIGDDDCCHIILLGGLSGFRSYRSGGK